MNDESIVIVGCGQAAFQLAGFLRDEGCAAPISLIGNEVHLPYQRPPLSKAYMNGDCEADHLYFQTREYYAKRNVGLYLGRRVVRIDRGEHSVETDSGEHFRYSHLVLATGARNRSLVDIGLANHGVLDLRGLDDARLIRERLATARDVVVIGAGFLGLEFASIAAKKGAKVTVLEAGATLMGRAVCPVVGEAFRRHHSSIGVEFQMGVALASIAPSEDGGTWVELSSGARLRADLVVASIGVQPNIELAAQCGLETKNGIVVDPFLSTSDPDVSAIGDCALFQSPSGLVRIESVQNALDHARCLARRLTGKQAAYSALPWFWSDQGGLKLQIAGLSTGADEVVVRGDVSALAFSAYRFRKGKLVAVESVARPTDHMLARRLLSAGVEVTPAHVSNPQFELKTLLPAAPPVPAPA